MFRIWLLIKHWNNCDLEQVTVAVGVACLGSHGGIVLGGLTGGVRGLLVRRALPFHLQSVATRRCCGAGQVAWLWNFTWHEHRCRIVTVLALRSGLHITRCLTLIIIRFILQ